MVMARLSPVHVGQGQHLLGIVVLDNGGDQALFVKFQFDRRSFHTPYAVLRHSSARGLRMPDLHAAGAQTALEGPDVHLARVEDGGGQPRVHPR